MKKTILILMVSILLIGIVTAGITISISNKNIKLDNTAQDIKAKEIGIDIYDVEDYEKDGLYRRCLISRVEYNLPCSNYMNESRLDDWEAMQIKGILDAEINTNNKVEIKIGEGETSLTK